MSIETYNSKFPIPGEKIKAESVNIIQDGLNEITSLWGISNEGNQTAVSGEPCRALLIQTWFQWLRSYANRIGAAGVLENIRVPVTGNSMLASEITEIYNATQIVKNWCNRSECNNSECNRNECNRNECHIGECNRDECNRGERGGGRGDR